MYSLSNQYTIHKHLEIVHLLVVYISIRYRYLKLYLSLSQQTSIQLYDTHIYIHILVNNTYNVTHTFNKQNF